MKVYSKLAKARKMLQESNLKKTGKGYGFVYFELHDFLPRITEIFAEMNLASFTTITKDSAKMTIVDGEDDSAVTFEIPFASFKADEKRDLQEVQELGGSITYLTRYLWVQALNIVEPDTVDSSAAKRSFGNQQTTQSQPVQQQTAVRRVAVAPQPMSPNQQTMAAINSDEAYPKLGDEAEIDGVQCVVKKNRNTGELFFAAKNPEIRFTKHIGPER